MSRKEKIRWNAIKATLKEAEAVVAARARGEPNVSVRKYLRAKVKVLQGNPEGWVALQKMSVPRKTKRALFA